MNPLAVGVYPAAVTPFDERGRIDFPAVARLLAYFESEGCRGVVLAGTNGEGPSLSAPEKRELIRVATGFAGALQLVLGVATPSIEEATWLCRQAGEAGAAAVLVMPPYFYRDVRPEEIEAWYRVVLDRSPVPVLVYNFPQRSGITLAPDLIFRLATHENFAGLKDSSGNGENLVNYSQAVPAGKGLYLGDETLLADAMSHGWTGSISGAANVIPRWLVQIVDEWATDPESSRTKQGLILPALMTIRRSRQPAGHKAILKHRGIIPNATVRLPLQEIEPGHEEELIAALSAI